MKKCCKQARTAGRAEVISEVEKWADMDARIDVKAGEFLIRRMDLVKKLAEMRKEDKT